jgi:hypothetical protein
VVTPSRLALHETGLLALSVRGEGVWGSADGRGATVPNPSGTGEQDLEQDLAATVAFAERGQVGLLVPLVETRRAVPGHAEWGYGLGDLSLSARWDFVRAGESAHLPGVALLAGAVLPSGRAVEQATQPLGSDATGTGTLQGAAGVEVEQLFGQVLVGGLLQGLLYAPRDVDGLHSQLGPAVAGALYGGWVFTGEQALVGLLRAEAGRDATVEGQTQAGSGPRRAVAGLSGVWPLWDWGRLQGSVSAELPGLTRNRLLGVAGQLTLVRAWR